MGVHDIVKLTLWLALIVGSISSAFGGQVVITSPDHAQTFAYSEMIWRQLSVDPASGVLIARITFSNLPYVSDNEPRTDEAYDFRFPGVLVDRNNRVLWARADHGEQITVARIQGGGSVDLSAGAKIYLLKKSGRVTAILTATDQPRPGLRWIQRDDNWSLQNLLADLFRRPRDPRG